MKKAYLYVVITAILFGTMEVSCKIGGLDLDPFQLTFLRFAIGGIVLLPLAVVRMRSRGVTLNGGDLLRLAVVGCLGVTISMSMFQISVVMCNASTVSVLICSNPFFTMIFAHFLTSEKMNRYKGGILLIAMMGIIFMLRPWEIQEGNSLLGMTLMIGAALFFGLYTVMGKVSQEKIGSIAQTSISFMFGSLFLLILLIVMDRPILEGVTSNIPIVLYTGFIVTGLGYFCYFRSIELSNASTGSFAFFLKPAIAPIIAVIVLHESILWNTVVGIILVLLASFLNILLQKRIARNRRERKACVTHNRHELGNIQPDIDCQKSIGVEKIRETFRNYRAAGEHGYKHFSILIPVIIGEGEELPSLLYEVRGSKLDRQPGEICFPGGLIEDDEYPEECALRETWEEIGIPKEEIEIIAKFDSVLSTSGSQLHSYIGLIRETSLEKLKPNECEVEEIFTVPVSTLISTEPEVYTNKLVQSPDENFPYERVTGGKMYPWRGGHSPVPVYEIQDRIIWGLTARLTKQFIEVLREGR